jgi:hypothetical protein
MTGELTFKLLIVPDDEGKQVLAGAMMMLH